METSLIRFMLYPVVLIGDLRKAYRSFLCDEDTAHFWMLHWFSDIPKCTKSVIYKRARVDYGDKSAAATLELFHWVFMTKACALALTTYILTEARYSDNLQFSFMTKKKCKKSEKTSFKLIKSIQST